MFRSSRCFIIQVTFSNQWSVAFLGIVHWEGNGKAVTVMVGNARALKATHYYLYLWDPIHLQHDFSTDVFQLTFNVNKMYLHDDSSSFSLCDKNSNVLRVTCKPKIFRFLPLLHLIHYCPSNLISPSSW